jgi:hypothetical protein
MISRRLSSIFRDVSRRMFFWRRDTIGLAVGADRLLAIGVDAGKETIAWALEAPATGDIASLRAQVHALLEKAPRKRWRARRPAIVAAVGPTLVQTKRIGRLPPLPSVEAMSDVVRASTSRFFIVGETPAAVSDVHLSQSGDPWAAAFERPVIDAIIAGCRDARLPLGGCVPEVSLLPRSFNPSSFVWSDGSVCVAISAVQGELDSVRPCQSALELQRSGGQHADLVEPLATLGEDARRFAGAYGAAIARGRFPALAAPLRKHANPGAPIPVWRTAVAIAACILALGIAAVAPAVTARKQSQRAETALAAIDAQRTTAVDATINLRQVTAALDSAARAASERQSILALLASVTAGLPDSSAIVTLRTDSTGGTIVVLSPRAAMVVKTLDGLEEMTAPQIVGPVTRETNGNRELDRVTVRFGLPRSVVVRR